MGFDVRGKRVNIPFLLSPTSHAVLFISVIVI